MASTELDRTRPGSSRRWLALGLLCLALFMDVLGSTTVFAAAPSIAGSFRLPASVVQWIFTAYALSFGGLLLLGGRAADVVGRRRLFMAGVAVFVASSALCGLAWTPAVLIVARAVQGAAAAFMAPAALSLVATTFEQGPDLNKALGIWSAVGGVGATAGLLVGGVLTSGWGWPAVFYLNVPVGIAMLVLSPLLLRAGAARGTKPRLNPAAALTITVALIAFVYAVTQAPAAGWASPKTAGLVAIAAALIAAFLIIESRTPFPMVPKSVLRSRSVVGGNLVLLGAGMSVDGLLFVFTLQTQQVLGYTAVAFGLLMAGMTAASTAAAYGSQRVVNWIGSRSTAVTGMGLIGLSCLGLIQLSVAGLGAGALLVALVVFGAGIGSAFVAGSIASLAGVNEAESGVAAGLQNTSFNIGNALGVALVSTVAAAVIEQMRGAVPAAALTAGYRAALFSVAVIAVITVTAALSVMRSRV